MAKTSSPDGQRLAKLTKQQGANKAEAAYADWWANNHQTLYSEHVLALRPRYREGRQLKQVARGRG